MSIVGERAKYVRPVPMFAVGLLALAVLINALFGSSVAVARPSQPTRTDRMISIMVAAMMNQMHVTEMEVNDEISKRALDIFFKTLDPMKLFFLQSDIDEFKEAQTKLDDFVYQGNLEIAKKIYDRFLERVDEQVGIAQEFVDAKHDYTVDETMVRDPEELEYAKSKEELRERWRKRVKYDLLIELADEVPQEEAIEKMHKRYRGILRNWEQRNNDDLLEDFLTAITSSFDPHSNYMSPSSFEDLRIRLRLELNGIGASLESKYGETIVRKIVPGGAADKDGRLQVDDVIVGVDQNNSGEFTDIVDMRITDVVQLIRGEPGTIVRLEVMPADKTGRKVYDITRARIELTDSEARSEVFVRPNAEEGKSPSKPESQEKEAQANSSNAPATEAISGKVLEHTSNPNGPTNRIGVISLPSFYMDMDGRRENKPDYKSTARDMRRILEEFKHQDIDLVVLDLRFNGGGSLPESVEVTGLFIDKGPVVQVKGPDGLVHPYEDEEAGEVWSGPLVVLVNRFSASASEIFAGAIQDYGRGIVVGDRATHGKGTVQNLLDLASELMRNPNSAVANLGALKLTIQQFYRPDGDSTQIRGVESDIVLPYRTSYWEGIGEEDLDYALKFDQVRPQSHRQYNMASAPMIKELRQRSEQRIAESKFFKEEQEKIAKLIQRQQEHTVTLNKEKFLAEREEMNAEKDQEETLEDLENEDAPVFASTPYNEEVLNIALDYLELLKSQKVAVTR